MKRNLMYYAIALAFGFASQAWADSSNDVGGKVDSNRTVTFSDSSTHNPTDNLNNKSTGDNRNNKSAALAFGQGSAAAANNASATSTITDSFKHSTVVALSRLEGTVSGIRVSGLGNEAYNQGSVTGGDSGKAYGGAAGKSEGGSAYGGNGGRGGSASGGAGGSNTGGAATGGTGGAAASGAGGAGGSVSVDAGTFNTSNTISGSFTNGAGIIVAAQNSGIGALVQQSANVQANLTVR